MALVITSITRNLIGIIIIVFTSLFVSTICAIQITRGPLNTLSVEQGETVQLRCMVSDQGDASVHWSHDDRKLSSDYELNVDDMSASRYRILDNGNRNVEFTLRISNVELSDAGRYRCGYYTTGGGPSTAAVSPRHIQTTILSVRAREDFQQQVAIPPDEGFPQCTVSPAQPQLDQTVRLTCVSQGGQPPARLQWMRDNVAITGESPSRVDVDRTLRAEDNGVEYTCQMSHPTLNRPLICRIKPLMIRPVVRIEPEAVIADEGQGALFTCVANGIVGMVNYKFFFNNADVSLLDPQRFIVSQDFRQLTILNVIFSDHNAAIRCEVSIQNGDGPSVNSTAILRVRNAIDDFTTTPLNNATATPLLPPVAAGPLGILSKPAFIVIIIIVGIVVGQLLCATAIFILHRCLTGRHDEAMKMEWKGVNQSRRDPHEIVPTLANWTVKRRYTDLQPGQVSDHRYQGLVTNSAAVVEPTRPDDLEMGVYEGVATTRLSGAIVVENEYGPPSGTSYPRPPAASAATREPSPRSPRQPPPRVPSETTELRQPSAGSSSPKPSTDSPRYPPRVPVGVPRVPPSTGLYKRPTSNALSSTVDETLSYQGSVKGSGPGSGKGTEEVFYDETPDAAPIYSEPAKEGDTIYEVPPDSDGYIHPNQHLPPDSDGYVNPDPHFIEDPDLDDYELPPTEGPSGYVHM